MSQGHAVIEKSGMTSGSRARETALRSGLGLIVGGWVGAMGLFAFNVAPGAFGQLPSAELAGQLVSPILSSLNYYGMGAGLCASGLAWALGRRRLLIVLPIGLSILCAISEFGVTASLGQVLPHDLGPHSAAGDAARFAELHRISRLLFFATLGGAALLLILHAWTDASQPTRFSKPGAST